MSHMLDIQALTKRFGNYAAVDGVSFTLGRGEVMGFLGPNGAGKTTTMRMITGFLPPTSGRAIVCGYDVVEDPIEVKRRIGYLPEGAPLYEDMTPASLLAFAAQVRGIHGAKRRDAVDHAVEQLKLGEVLQQPIGTLSKGFKRRVGLAQAILHNPDILILDEPTDGLDPNQKHEVRTLIRRMAENKAIVISTHILEEVEPLCTRAAIIARGKIVFDSTPAELYARSSYHNAVHVRIKSDEVTKAVATFERMAGVARVERLDPVNGYAGIVVLPKDGRAIVTEVSAQARASGLGLEELRVEAGRLDEVFRSITTSKH